MLFRVCQTPGQTFCGSTAENAEKGSTTTNKFIADLSSLLSLDSRGRIMKAQPTTTTSKFIADLSLLSLDSRPGNGVESAAHNSPRLSISPWRAAAAVHVGSPHQHPNRSTLRSVTRGIPTARRLHLASLTLENSANQSS